MIKELTIHQLLDLLEQETRRDHYDPFGDMPDQEYTVHEIRQEIIRRCEPEVVNFNDPEDE